MGLGKTIMTLSLLLYRRRSSASTPGTLIVCPLTLLGQWKVQLYNPTPLQLYLHRPIDPPKPPSVQSEISVHCEKGALSVCEYYGTDRDKDSTAMLTQHDVVLTTYGTLVSEYSRQVSPPLSSPIPPPFMRCCAPRQRAEGGGAV